MFISFNSKYFHYINLVLPINISIILVYFHRWKSLRLEIKNLSIFTFTYNYYFTYQCWQQLSLFNNNKYSDMTVFLGESKFPFPAQLCSNIIEPGRPVPMPAKASWLLRIPVIVASQELMWLQHAYGVGAYLSPRKSQFKVAWLQV